MSEVLTDETVARLHLSDAQIQAYRRQLGEVLTYLDLLQQLEVENVEPMAHPLALANRLHDDIVEPSLPLKSLLDLAPETRDGLLVVPKVIAEGGG